MQVANMGFTTIIKTVMVLGWLCMADGQQFGGQRQQIIQPEIIFPDQIQNNQFSNNRQSAISNNPAISIKPRCTNNLGDDGAPCLDDEDYNASVENLFTHLLARFRGNQVVRNKLFQNLINPELIPQIPSTRIRPAGSTRINFITESPVCAAEETIIYPKRAKTEKEEWVFVLNQGNNRQGVKVEKCFSNNRACNLGAARTEVNSVCRQKYIYKKLLVMNSAGDDIVPESVLMPSCCVCYIKNEIQSFAEDDIFHFARQKNETTSVEGSGDLDSVQETTEEATLAPSTDKETVPINFQIEE